MFHLLIAALILANPGHHKGWQQPHNPHHQSCVVVFHVGCPSTNPPPTQITWTNPPPVPSLP